MKDYPFCSLSSLEGSESSNFIKRKFQRWCGGSVRKCHGASMNTWVLIPYTPVKANACKPTQRSRTQEDPWVSCSAALAESISSRFIEGLCFKIIMMTLLLMMMMWRKIKKGSWHQPLVSTLTHIQASHSKESAHSHTQPHTHTHTVEIFSIDINFS